MASIFQPALPPDSAWRHRTRGPARTGVHGGPGGRRARTAGSDGGSGTAGLREGGSPSRRVRALPAHGTQYTETPYADSASVTGWWMAEPAVPEQPELPEWMPRATDPAKCAPPLSPPAEQAVVRTML